MEETLIIKDKHGNVLKLGDYVIKKWEVVFPYIDPKLVGKRRRADGKFTENVDKIPTACEGTYQIRIRNGKWVLHFGGGYQEFKSTDELICEKIFALGVNCSPLGPGAELFNSKLSC